MEFVGSPTLPMINAKKLYDKIANNTGFELYELKGN